MKDVIDTKGVRTTCHSRLLIDNIPADDAACIARLKAAGAILLGKLSTHEFAFGGPSHDLPFPAARNPWALDRVPGGSSSGSGVAVAAGLCAAALGSDTSGSIRMPAGNCGIVGVKPTYGRVSRRGLYPLSFSLDHIGPMAWTVRDCAIVLQAIAGHDPDDPGSVDQPVPDFLAAIDEPLAGLRIGIVRSWFKRSEPRLELLAVRQLITDTLALLEPELRNAHVLVELRLQPALPQVRADRVLIEQVLANLVRNSVDAMRETPAERRRLLVSASWPGEEGA